MGMALNIMNKSLFVSITILFLGLFCSSQTVLNLMDEVNQNRLQISVAELSGEQSTIINGTSQIISSRVQSNNDLAANYIEERLSALNNLTVTVQDFNTAGKNIIATQLGQTNPDDIYIVCAHYDSVTTFCADDNATGVAAVLEIARILSTQCTDNTIIYALWDEEEIGLRGADYFATQAADTSNGNTRDNIIAVVNMDMVGFDGDAPGTTGDNDFDIDVRPYASSLTIKDDLLSLLSTYTFDLNPIVVNPGTFSSDHSRFWLQDYSAVLVGESWETNDQTPDYHTSGDQLEDIDLPYFTEITKLVMAYMASKASLSPVDNTVTQNASSLVANQQAAIYQWYDDNTNTPITNQTNREYFPTADGTYSVEVTLNGCTERSNSIVFNTLNFEEFTRDEMKVYPNPTSTLLTIESTLGEEITIVIRDFNGKNVLKQTSSESEIQIPMTKLASGVYFAIVSSGQKKSAFKVVKE